MNPNHISKRERRQKTFRFPALVFVLLLALILTSTGLVETAYAKTAADNRAVSESSTSQKNGIRKENNKYYYYVDGKKQKHQWVKVAGKTYYLKKDGSAAVASCKIGGTYYIFSEKGVLYQPAQKKVVSVNGKKYQVGKNGKAVKGWNQKKTYRFRENGAAYCGTVMIDGKFYMFAKAGKYLPEKTKKLRKAAKANQSMTPVYQLLGKPKKSQYQNGCYSMEDPKTGRYISGMDGILTYQNLYVYTMKAGDGREFYIGAETK